MKKELAEQKPQIPNTQIEGMFMRIANDREMVVFNRLCSDGNTHTATSYASRKVNEVFYPLVEEHELTHGTIETLKR